MRVFALVDLSLQEAIELFLRREDAERMLSDVLRDDPDWKRLVRIEEIELVDTCWN